MLKNALRAPKRAKDAIARLEAVEKKLRSRTAVRKKRELGVHAEPVTNGHSS